MGAARGPDTFSNPDAPVTLGVGKNMVNAIRYWGLAYKVLEERSDPDRPRLPHTVVSSFGEALLGDGGWDPYLEDEGSLWLLHWMLMRAPCLVPAWWIAFNAFSNQQWDEELLASHIDRLVRTLPGWPGIVHSSIRKDVNCLVRTLAPRKEGRQGLDDVIDSPFRELHLLEAAPGEAREVRFTHGTRAGLPDEILTFAALDFAASRARTANSITLPTLCRDPGSPGLVFKLSEEAIHLGLEGVARENDKLHLAEPAGLRQVLFDGPAGDIGLSILSNYYRRRTGSRVRVNGAIIGKSSGRVTVR